MSDYYYSPFQHSNCAKPVLGVIKPVILKRDDRSFKDYFRIDKVLVVFAKIGLSLCLGPFNSHQGIIVYIYTYCKLETVDEDPSTLLILDKLSTCVE